MSGFTRDPRYYDDQLVYEALLSKWDRYHARCRCGEDWIGAHAEPAGFTVVRRGSGFVALVGPGLTIDVDESRLTANALWEAVTGSPGTQDWFETVHVMDRSPAVEAERKKANDEYYGARRERSRTAKAEPLSAAQLKYLTSLAAKTSRERFDEQFARAVKGSSVTLRSGEEKTAAALKRLTKATARKLITGLLDGRP